jgi:hypothetical protein
MKDQLAQRKNQFRQSLRPQDDAILGQSGLAYLLKENIKDMRLDPEEAIPELQMIEKGIPFQTPPLQIENKSKPIPESSGGGPQ